MDISRNLNDEDDEALAIEELRQWIRQEGLAEAKAAMLSILRNDKAPAAARASVVNTMLRAAGAFEQPKAPQETDPDPIAAALAGVTDPRILDELDRMLAVAAERAHLASFG